MGGLLIRYNKSNNTMILYDMNHVQSIILSALREDLSLSNASITITDLKILPGCVTFSALAIINGEPLVMDSMSMPVSLFSSCMSMDTEYADIVEFHNETLSELNDLIQNIDGGFAEINKCKDIMNRAKCDFLYYGSNPDSYKKYIDAYKRSIESVCMFIDMLSNQYLQYRDF